MAQSWSEQSLALVPVEPTITRPRSRSFDLTPPEVASLSVFCTTECPQVDELVIQSLSKGSRLDRQAVINAQLVRSDWKRHRHPDAEMVSDLRAGWSTSTTKYCGTSFVNKTGEWQPKRYSLRRVVQRERWSDVLGFFRARLFSWG